MWFKNVFSSRISNFSALPGKAIWMCKLAFPFYSYISYYFHIHTHLTTGLQTDAPHTSFHRFNSLYLFPWQLPLTKPLGVMVLRWWQATADNVSHLLLLVMRLRVHIVTARVATVPTLLCVPSQYTQRLYMGHIFNILGLTLLTRTAAGFLHLFSSIRIQLLLLEVTLAHSPHLFYCRCSVKLPVTFVLWNCFSVNVNCLLGMHSITS